MKLFTIYDNGIKAFKDPFPLRHVNEAKRIFIAETKNPQSELSKYPEDYALYECGEFVNDTGEFHTPDYPVKVLTGLEALKIAQETKENE